MRELFIEELAEIKGGADPIGPLRDWVRQQLVTTTACGEEIPNPFC